MKRQYDGWSKSGCSIALSIAAILAIAVTWALAVNRHGPGREVEPDPCVAEDRGYLVICDGVPCGCTGDSSNYRG